MGYENGVITYRTTPHRVLNHPLAEPVRGFCKQGVRGSSPLGSTTGQRPSPDVRRGPLSRPYPSEVETRQLVQSPAQLVDWDSQPRHSDMRGKGRRAYGGRRVQDTMVTGLVLGGAIGAYVGYQIGVWRAATRAARATYRTQRGLGK